ncbi:ShlB/FhaC/HecB family hemolysin secretion/activation protein [Oxalicibacterium faecigallinarum]|uniref:ShlB/FhaC/HecB family hemolysin secretion/activation protein n=1 Tax=Oxalicibacterium faecigallinarum TaxID=573741 RepID=UPI0016696997|nr:ShlB/FhaC/HecB family hemolysin secretion/activation protein [Oxalicibacterium faecigallinarum]
MQAAVSSFPRKWFSCFVLFLIGGLFIPLFAGAQSFASDELLKQQERERQRRLQQEQVPDVRLQSPAGKTTNLLQQNEVPCFPIERVTLVGDAADRFQFALRKVVDGDDTPIGKCLGANGINLVLTRIQNSIVEQGFVTTRVLVAPQDIQRGDLAITVIPGRVRNIRFAEDADARGTRWNAMPIRSGDILNLRDIEQGLENFKRVPTATADIRIEPAEGEQAKPGESDLVIAYQQTFPFRLSLFVDDSGSKSTGKYQGGVTLSYDNWWTLNDLFYVSINHDLGGGDAGARGTRGSTVHYSIPFGYWMLSTTATRYRYFQSVAGMTQTYLYSGTSRNNDLRLSRIVYRDAQRKTTVSIRGYLKESDNFIDDTEVQTQRRRTAGWEVGVGHREFIGANTLDLNIAYRRGTGAFHALEAPEDAFGEGASRPKVWNVDASLSVPLQFAQQYWRYLGALRMQWNDTPLVPQDRFAIGGRYTVRGFDGSMILSADRGWTLRNDVGLILGSSGQEIYFGLDYGEVGGQASQYLVGTRLAGTVLGLRGSILGGAYDVFVGQPIKKPDGFVTANTTAGFSLNWSY